MHLPRHLAPSLMVRSTNDVRHGSRQDLVDALLDPCPQQGIRFLQ